MAIKSETVDAKLSKKTSNKAKMLRKISTGELYTDAVDPTSKNVQYEETAIDIPVEATPVPDGCLRDACPLVIAAGKVKSAK